MENMQAIRSEIESHRSAGTPVSMPDLFSKIGWDNFWPAHYGNTPLDVTFVDITSDNDTLLSYSAKTQFLNVAFPDATVNFQPSAAGVDISIDMPLPDTWHFSQSFPKLPPSLDLSVIPFQSTSSYLDRLPIAKPRFRISTAKMNGDDEGLNFLGDLTLQGPYDIIKNLCDENVLPVHGNIQLGGDDSSLALKADIFLKKGFLLNSPDLRITDISANMFSLLEVRNFDANVTQVPTRQEWFDFRACLHFKNDTYKVDLRAVLVLGNADFIFMQGVFEDGHKLKIPSLGELATMAGNYDLEQILPEQLKGDTNLAVSELDFSFTVADYKVNYIGFTVELNKTFTILDKDDVKIVLKNVQAHFQVAYPFDNASRSVSFYLTGEFDFGDEQHPDMAQIVVKANSSLVFYCGLKPGSKVDIGQVFDHFKQGDLLKSMNIRDAAVEKFDITVDFNNSCYGFYLDIDGHWTIPAGKLSFDVTDINLAIVKMQTINFSAGGKFVLAGAEFTIGISKADNAFTFSGVAQPADNATIQLGKFIDELIGKSLPKEIADQLSTLNVDYLQCILGTQELYFEIDIDFDLGFGKEKVIFYAQRTLDSDNAANYEIYFEYDIDYDIYFDLKLDWGQETVLSGELKTRSGMPVALDIDAVLQKIGTSLGIIKIPKIDKINLESAGFNLNLTKKSFTLDGKFSGLNLLLVAEKNDTWGFALAVDYSSTTQFSDVTHVAAPGFVQIGDLYAAFSTIERTLPFNTANAHQPSLELKKNAFNLGCHLLLNGSASMFIEKHFGKTIDLWINGAIVFSPAFSLYLAVDFDAGPRVLDLSGDNKKHPSISFNQLRAFISVTEQNLLVGLACQITASINNKDVVLVGKLALEENQFEISGTLKEGIVSFDLFGYDVQLNNLAIEIGDGYELIDPVIGFTGEITVAGVNGFLAVLADTAEPQNCMFAASCSAIKGSSLAKLVKQLCFKGDATSVNSLDALDKIAIQGTDIQNNIACTDEMVEQLNAGKLPQVIADLLKIPKPVITGGGKDVEAWFVLNNSTSQIYELRKNGNVLDLRNELQLYIVPGASVTIGDLPPFTRGFRLDGCLDIFDFEADLHIDVSPNGIELDGSIKNAIDLGILVIADANDPKKGPSVSLSTLAKNPHFTLSSRLTVAKIINDSADISFSNKNFHIDLKADFFSFHAEFKASGDYSQLLSASFSFDIDIQTDLLAVVAANISNSIKDAANSADAGFKKLESAVDAARSKVDNLQNSIDAIDVTIGAKNNAIAQLKHQQSGISDWDYLWGKGEVEWCAYAAQIAAIGLEIGGLYTGRGTLVASKKIADGVLKAAEDVLNAGETVTDEALGALATAIAEMGKAADWFLHFKRVSIGIAVSKMNATSFDTVFDVTFLGKEHTYTLNVDFNLHDVAANIEKGLHDLLYKDLTTAPPKRMVAAMGVEEQPLTEAEQTMNIVAPDVLSGHIDLLSEIVGRQQTNLGADHINNNIELDALQASMASAKAAYIRRDELQASYQALDTAAINKVVDQTAPVVLSRMQAEVPGIAVIDDCIQQVNQVDTTKVYKGDIDKTTDPNTSDADKLARLNNATDLLSLLETKAPGFDSATLQRLKKLIDDKKGAIH